MTRTSVVVASELPNTNFARLSFLEPYARTRIGVNVSGIPCANAEAHPQRLVWGAEWCPPEKGSMKGARPTPPQEKIISRLKWRVLVNYEQHFF